MTFKDQSSGNKKANYNLITTINLAMAFDSKICRKVLLTGTISRCSKLSKEVNDYTKDEAHITNIGVLVE